MIKTVTALDTERINPVKEPSPIVRQEHLVFTPSPRQPTILGVTKEKALTFVGKASAIQNKIDKRQNAEKINTAMNALSMTPARPVVTALSFVRAVGSAVSNIIGAFNYNSIVQKLSFGDALFRELSVGIQNDVVSSTPVQIQNVANQLPIRKLYYYPTTTAPFIRYGETPTSDMVSLNNSDKEEKSWFTFAEKFGGVSPVFDAYTFGKPGTDQTIQNWLMTPTDLRGSGLWSNGQAELEKTNYYKRIYKYENNSRVTTLFTGSENLNISGVSTGTQLYLYINDRKHAPVTDIKNSFKPFTMISAGSNYGDFTPVEFFKNYEVDIKQTKYNSIINPVVNLDVDNKGRAVDLGLQQTIATRQNEKIFNYKWWNLKNTQDNIKNLYFIITDIIAGTFVVFDATISSLTDTVTPTFHDTKYIGNPLKGKAITEYSRTIPIKFTLQADCKTELIQNINKLNFLYNLSVPMRNISDAGNGLITRIVSFSFGDMYNQLKCVITNFSTSIDIDSLWEVDPLYRYPHKLEVDLTFEVVYDNLNYSETAKDSGVYILSDADKFNQYIPYRGI